MASEQPVESAPLARSLSSSFTVGPRDVDATQTESSPMAARPSPNCRLSSPSRRESFGIHEDFRSVR
jgi:hypothetical protein